MVTTFIPTESLEAQCPECGAIIRLVGRRRRVQCPKCREVVTLSTPEPGERPQRPPSAAAAKAGGEPDRLEALESRIASIENSKREEQSSPREAIEPGISGIESAKLNACSVQLEAHGSKLEAHGSKLEALEARLAAIEERMKTASASDPPCPQEKTVPAPNQPGILTRTQEPLPRQNPAEVQPATPVFGQAVRIPSPDELENPIPGLPPLARMVKAASVPPGRLRWLAPDESHAPGISPVQEEVLIHNLRTIRGQQITIRTITGNPFSRMCAESFHSIFERAGWTVRGVEEIPRAIPEPGLSLAVATLPVEKEAAATYLALKASGFSPAVILDTTLATGGNEDAVPLSLTLGPAKRA